MKNTGNDYLIQRLVNQLSRENGIHICIHYSSGTFQGNKVFEINNENEIHRSDFCDAAKTTSCGLRCCIKNKGLSIKKAEKLGSTYIGKCYLGITEIVTPIIYENRLLCIAYIGNMVMREELDDISNRIRKMCRVTGVKESMLLEKLNSAKQVTAKDMDYYLEMAGVLSSVIRLCVSCFAAEQKKAMNGQQSKESVHWIVQQVINNIENYYNTNIRLSMFANLYNVNSQYLCRLFKKETGENFSDYLNRIRVENAVRRIESTSETITEIALSAGFNSCSYFDTIFKKYMSCTPNQYRKTRGM